MLEQDLFKKLNQDLCPLAQVCPESNYGGYDLCVSGDYESCSLYQEKQEAQVKRLELYAHRVHEIDEDEHLHFYNSQGEVNGIGD